MMTDRPIAEEELHAYIDNALDPVRRAEVESYLGDHPEVAQRIRGYEAQRQALREALAPIAEEPIPPTLNLARLIEARQRPARTAFWRAAAAILLFAAGGAAGWAVHGTPGREATGIAALAREAAYTYAVYGPDHIHPVEYRADDTAQLTSWLSERLGSPVAVPDLAGSGYRFMGGRLVATPQGPAGLLMFDNDHGTRLVMLVRPMKIEKTARMSPYTDGTVDGFAWASRGLGYSLVGAAPPEILHPIANEIRRQLGASI
jgi:anti-sigma factor RsiW